MKKYLLAENGQFYKANLHCHSIFSDGKLTPAELKEMYKAKGYSIIAFTDHDVLIAHPELADEEFLPLNGFELEINDDQPCHNTHWKSCHICMIALEQDNLEQVCWKPYYVFANAKNYMDMVKIHKPTEGYVRKHNPDCISEMMQIGRDNGFFVTYNHPVWSLEDYNDYINYHGMHAMEICNYASTSEGYPEYSPKVYDDILRGGERIYCIAADDNHNRKPADHPNFDSFGAFTVIKAERLEYRTITKALEEGQFYASQGPEIYDLWFEDGKVHITCSNVDRITISTGRRRAERVCKEKDKPLCEATFDVFEEDKYFRITVVDEKGCPANTNAYFTDELFE